MKEPATYTLEYLRARAGQCAALASQTQNLASRKVFQTLAIRWRKLAAKEAFRAPTSDDASPANVAQGFSGVGSAPPLFSAALPAPKRGALVARVTRRRWRCGR